MMGSATETSVHYVDGHESQPVHGAGILPADCFRLLATVRPLPSAIFRAKREVNLDDLEQSSLKVTIQAASLSVKDDISDKDRREIERNMQQEILESFVLSRDRL